MLTWSDHRESNGCKSLLTVIDWATHYLVAIPLQSTEAAKVWRTFKTHWVGSFGIPHQIVSDRGSQLPPHIVGCARSLQTSAWKHQQTTLKPTASWSTGIEPSWQPLPASAVATTTWPRGCPLYSLDSTPSLNLTQFTSSYILLTSNFPSKEAVKPHRYTNNTPRSDIFFSGSPTLPSRVLRLYTQV